MLAGWGPEPGSHSEGVWSTMSTSSLQMQVMRADQQPGYVWPETRFSSMIVIVILSLPRRWDDAQYQPRGTVEASLLFHDASVPSTRPLSNRRTPLLYVSRRRLLQNGLHGAAKGGKAARRVNA